MRSSSMSQLGRSTHRELRELKNYRMTRYNIQKWGAYRSSYEHGLPRLASQPRPQREQPEEQKHQLNSGFEGKCRVVCKELCLSLDVFASQNKDNDRKKGLLKRVNSWDEEFEKVFFQPHREQLRPGLTDDLVFAKMGFQHKTNESNNRFIKLRLFLSELKKHNKTQQEQQSKLMKTRVTGGMRDVDEQLMEIMGNRGRVYLSKYAEEISSTQEMMLNTKLRTHNKEDELRRATMELGPLGISDFYSRQERSISDMERHFITHRLRRQPA